MLAFCISCVRMGILCLRACMCASCMCMYLCAYFLCVACLFVRDFMRTWYTFFKKNFFMCVLCVCVHASCVGPACPSSSFLSQVYAPVLLAMIMKSISLRVRHEKVPAVHRPARAIDHCSGALLRTAVVCCVFCCTTAPGGVIVDVGSLVWRSWVCVCASVIAAVELLIGWPKVTRYVCISWLVPGRNYTLSLQRCQQCGPLGFPCLRICLFATGCVCAFPP